MSNRAEELGLVDYDLTAAQSPSCARRDLNAELAVQAYDAGRGLALHRPVDIYLQVASACNLDCYMCAEHNRPEQWKHGRGLKSLPPELFAKIEREVFPYAKRLTIGVGGEPMISKHFLDYLERAKAAGLEIHVMTNGTMINTDRKAEALARCTTSMEISVDGATPETYERVRIGSRWERLIGNIQRLNRFRDKAPEGERTHLTLCYVLMKSNVHEFPLFVDLGKALGADRVSGWHVIPMTPEGHTETLQEDKARSNAFCEAARARGKELGIEVDVPEPFPLRKNETEPEIELPDFDPVIPFHIAASLVPPTIEGDPEGQPDDAEEFAFADTEEDAAPPESIDLQPVGMALPSATPTRDQADASDKGSKPAKSTKSAKTAKSGKTAKTTGTAAALAEPKEAPASEPVGSRRPAKISAEANSNGAMATSSTKETPKLEGELAEKLEAASKAEATTYQAPQKGGMVREASRNKSQAGRIHCSSPSTSVFLFYDGRVLPCCHPHAHNTLPMGNLHDQSFAKIWNSLLYQNLREGLHEGDAPPLCQSCSIVHSPPPVVERFEDLVGPGNDLRSFFADRVPKSDVDAEKAFVIEALTKPWHKQYEAIEGLALDRKELRDGYKALKEELHSEIEAHKNVGEDLLSQTESLRAQTELISDENANMVEELAVRAELLDEQRQHIADLEHILGRTGAHRILKWQKRFGRLVGRTEDQDEARSSESHGSNKDG